MSMLQNVAHHSRLSELVGALLVYLGIATTFAVVSSLVLVTWLLIW